jgi:hypothetical protein
MVQYTYSGVKLQVGNVGYWIPPKAHACICRNAKPVPTTELNVKDSQSKVKKGQNKID